MNDEKVKLEDQGYIPLPDHLVASDGVVVDDLVVGWSI